MSNQKYYQIQESIYLEEALKQNYSDMMKTWKNRNAYSAPVFAETMISKIITFVLITLGSTFIMEVLWKGVDWIINKGSYGSSAKANALRVVIAAIISFFLTKSEYKSAYKKINRMPINDRVKKHKYGNILMALAYNYNNSLRKLSGDMSKQDKYRIIIDMLPDIINEIEALRSVSKSLDNSVYSEKAIEVYTIELTRLTQRLRDMKAEVKNMKL